MGGIKGISFSRNFGKESAIFAGLSYSRGDAVITIDSDLQHPPQKIPEFIEKWEHGAKIVEGKKNSRGQEKKLYTRFAGIFYRSISKAIGEDLNQTSDYKLIDREVVKIITTMPEKQMFYRAITSWIGFKTDTVEFHVLERIQGSSKWSYAKLVKYAIRNITSFTSSPLQIITVFSVMFFILGIMQGMMAIAKWIDGTALEGFTTVILLQLISGALIMFALGIMGYYIAKICDEIRDRPRYIVADKIDNEKAVSKRGS